MGDKQQSRKKMLKAKVETGSGSQSNTPVIDDLGDDLMQNIFSRLPALSFASAACVSRLWNSICHRVMPAPKLRSAVSLNPILENAVNEVLEKVLDEPIRPHFVMASVGSRFSYNAVNEVLEKVLDEPIRPHFVMASVGSRFSFNAVNEVLEKVLDEPIRPHFVMASVGSRFSLEAAFHQINGKFRSKIPVIVNVCEGVIGRDVLTDKFVEVQWEVAEEDDLGAELLEQKTEVGITLTIGFLPGLKAHIIPLLLKNKGPQGVLIDDFVMDIREAASTVSNSTSPAGIILFSDRDMDINPVLQTLEYAFSEDTFIVGDGSSEFLFQSDTGNANTNTSDSGYAAVALLFTRDRNKPSDIGETQFHVMLSNGVSPIGPTYKAASVKCRKRSTWLTASRENVRGHLDGLAILEEIHDELGDRTPYPALYVGVSKRRKCSVGKERVRRMQFLEFHEVRGGDQEYLIVNSAGIKTGDPFRFYISDPEAGLASCTEVSNNLSHLKLESDNRKVFGGIVFTCYGRGESFFGLPGIDSSPFVKNFPGVTFGGSYCAGEICRGNLNLYDHDNEEGDLVNCGQHVFSAVYLVMSYCPPSPAAAAAQH